MYTELWSQPPTLELNVYATLREIAEEVIFVPPRHVSVKSALIFQTPIL